ncbi:hypothetical protein GQ651_13690 [Alphaproteobacteria bacterium GH1-50]|uniref:TVP38/TMEM64 family membrane protein n=1 Tax=Kangsaoukella pontilimi TaxID=2691042 RepID=A0A7C9J4Q2_9RHOB|nr:hypothetical protein [Kangsaoukella pontilimi]MXQ08901.1 hypothetical protein [Kangsaoukella pontilimi]
MGATLNRLRSRWRVLLFWIVLLGIGWLVGDALRTALLPELRPMDTPMFNKMVVSALVLYVVLAAIPFVPGAEIGFALLFLFGAVAAPVVYLGMVGALTLSFLIARLVPHETLCGGLAWLGLKRTAALVRRIHETPAAERDAILLELVPEGALKKAFENRYVTLAILINTPGNSLIGGGGGLAFAAGASGLYGLPQFLLTILIAVAPLPVFFFLTM